MRFFSSSGKLLLVVAAAVLSVVAASPAARSGTNDVNIDDEYGSGCQLRLYRVQSFQDRAFVIKSDKRRLRGLEKSVKIIGKCCWALYAHKNFKGRPMYIGAGLSLRSTSKWGWRRNKIRSAKKLDSCDLP